MLVVVVAPKTAFARPKASRTLATAFISTDVLKDYTTETKAKNE